MCFDWNVDVSALTEVEIEEIWEHAKHQGEGRIMGHHVAINIEDMIEGQYMPNAQIRCGPFYFGTPDAWMLAWIFDRFNGRVIKLHTSEG